MGSVAYKFVNERSNCVLTFTVLDELGNPYIPNSIKYRVDDVYSSFAIDDWTSLEPLGSTTAISIPAITNSLIDQKNKSELRKLTLVVDENLSSESTSDFTYEVRSLDFYS